MLEFDLLSSTHDAGRMVSVSVACEWNTSGTRAMMRATSLQEVQSEELEG